MAGEINNPATAQTNPADLRTGRAFDKLVALASTAMLGSAGLRSALGVHEWLTRPNFKEKARQPRRSVIELPYVPKKAAGFGSMDGMPNRVPTHADLRHGRNIDPAANSRVLHPNGQPSPAGPSGPAWMLGTQYSSPEIASRAAQGLARTYQATNGAFGREKAPPVMLRDPSLPPPPFVGPPGRGMVGPPSSAQAQGPPASAQMVGPPGRGLVGPPSSAQAQGPPRPLGPMTPPAPPVAAAPHAPTPPAPSPPQMPRDPAALMAKGFARSMAQPAMPGQSRLGAPGGPPPSSVVDHPLGLPGAPGSDMPVPGINGDLIKGGSPINVNQKKGEEQLPEPSGLAQGLVSALGLSHADNAGGFAGALKNRVNPPDATSVAQMPWFWGAAIPAGLGGAYLGWKGPDAVFKGLRQSDEELELDEAKKRYEDELRNVALAKAGSDLDAAYESFTKSANPLSYWEGLLASILSASTLGAGAWAYNQNARASSSRVMEEALKRRQRELYTRHPRPFVVKPVPIQRPAPAGGPAEPDEDETKEGLGVPAVSAA